MTPEQARELFNEHREPGDMAHYGEKAAVAAIMKAFEGVDPVALHETRNAMYRLRWAADSAVPWIRSIAGCEKLAVSIEVAIAGANALDVSE